MALYLAGHRTGAEPARNFIRRYRGDFLAEDRYADWAIDVRREIAALAPVLLHAAADGDAVAHAIVDAAAESAAKLVQANATKLGFDADVPLAAAGGFIGLELVDRFLAPQPFDILVMLGFIILVGTVVNNAILIVHQALNNVRQEGLRGKEAVLHSVRTRIRPIFMSTSTSLFGLLPLVLVGLEPGGAVVLSMILLVWRMV